MQANSAKALLLSLSLTACAGNGTPLPATTRILDDLPRVANSTKAPCRLQKEVAAQNSYLDSIKGQREIVYKAPCEVDKPQVASAEKQKS